MGSGSLAVGSTISKGIDASPAERGAVLGTRPVSGICDNLYSPIVELDLGVDGFDANGSWDAT